MNKTNKNYYHGSPHAHYVIYLRLMPAASPFAAMPASRPENRDMQTSRMLYISPEEGNNKWAISLLHCQQ